MALKTEKLEEVRAEDEINFQSLTIDFFDRLENKTTKLVSNDDPQHFLKGRYKLFPFYFKEANFIQSIKITLDGYSSSDTVEFYWISPNSGQTQISKQRVVGNQASIVLNEVISGFGFRPPRKHFKKPSIQKVEVTGLTLGNFSDACDKIGNFSNVKSTLLSECAAAISKVNEKEATVIDLEESKDTLETNIAELNAKVSELNIEIGNLERSLIK